MPSINIPHMRPVAPYIIVERLPAGSRLSEDSLIILPDTQYVKNRRCKVKAVHKGHFLRTEKRAVHCKDGEYCPVPHFKTEHIYKPSQVQENDLVELVLFDEETLDRTDLASVGRCREEDILCIVHISEEFLTPLGNRVVLETVEPPKVSSGGILLPESIGSDKPTEGTVVQVGAGVLCKETGEYIPDTDLEPGDRVHFLRYEGTPVTVGTKKFLVIDTDKVLCKVVRE
jgi:co-chaperonin GroES (HSP10)